MIYNKQIEQCYFLDENTYSVIFCKSKTDTGYIKIAVELDLTTRDEFIEAIKFKNNDICTEVIDARNILSKEDISDYIDLSYENYEQRLSKNNS